MVLCRLMKQKLLITAVVVVCLGLMVYAMLPAGLSYSYRYKLSLDVTANGSVHRGSSIIAVHITEPPQDPIYPGVTTRIYGEAAYVDLGGGRNVIALLASGPKAANHGYPSLVIPGTYNVGMRFDEFKKVLLEKGERTVSENNYPTFATFLNPEDPKSFRFLSEKDFQKVLGADVHLKSVRVEITDLQTTHNISGKLPWWNRNLSTDLKINPNELEWHRGLFERSY
jgi:hypothetical protein